MNKPPSAMIVPPTLAFCDCDQGRLPCSCRSSGLLSLSIEDVRALSERLRILRKARQVQAERSVEERERMARHWLHDLRLSVHRFPKIKWWNE